MWHSLPPLISSSHPDASRKKKNETPKVILFSHTSSLSFVFFLGSSRTLQLFPMPCHGKRKYFLRSEKNHYQLGTKKTLFFKLNAFGLHLHLITSWCAGDDMQCCYLAETKMKKGDTIFFPNGVSTSLLYGVQGNWLGRLARMGSGHDIASGAAMKCAAPVGPPTEKGRTMSRLYFYALKKKTETRKKFRFSRKTRDFVKNSGQKPRFSAFFTQYAYKKLRSNSEKLSFWLIL